jgi:glutathione peroxidase
MNLWQSVLMCLAVGMVTGAASAAESIHEFKVKSLDEKDVDLAEYKGKVLLIVNVASECGLTPQYSQLQALQDKYSSQGLVVLGFPCNQFGSQEPGSATEIRKFCTEEYKVTFPLFSKIEVNGKNQAPVYDFLKKHAENQGNISWNFEKFIVGKDGKVISRVSPKVKPDAPEVVSAIEAALKN